MITRAREYSFDQLDDQTLLYLQDKISEVCRPFTEWTCKECSFKEIFSGAGLWNKEIENVVFLYDWTCAEIKAELKRRGITHNEGGFALARARAQSLWIAV